ncbi:hypothetical protein QP185_10100 [Sphingomonas aerolata]|uniref:hypothetical protein n=1 Tax=Sphingomonas aerolata TaxID=185951 RepID=UPI002FDF50CC
MTLTLADLFASPDHYLHSFDGDATVFVPMDRAAYHRSIFLDARISPAAEGAMRVPVAALANAVPAAAPTAWIMHVAHCGSTLLARALDDADANLVLREPQALRQIAFAPEDPRLALTAAMLSKRYRADRPTIVKGNVPTNFLLPRIAAMAPTAPVILLHLSLRDYLLAILRSDNHRTWLRAVTTQLAGQIAFWTGQPEGGIACVRCRARSGLVARADAALCGGGRDHAERTRPRRRAVLRHAGRGADRGGGASRGATLRVGDRGARRRAAICDLFEKPVGRVRQCRAAGTASRGGARSGTRA